MHMKQIDEIEFSDIDVFVGERHKESILLDYREDWPSDLAKVIAAMANTQGGLMLIGVSEHDNTGYPGDIVGVDIEEGEDHLRRRVSQTAYRGVYPPLMPEIQVCRLARDPSRAVVVVRIAQSDHTPHAIDNRRRVYVRVDSTSQPHSLASLDQLAWLWDGRRKAVEGREGLVAQATERANWFQQHQAGLKKRQALAAQCAILRAWVAPYFYMGEDVLSLSAMTELARTLPSRPLLPDVQVGMAVQQFPSCAREARSVPNGYCVYSRGFPPGEYIELGASGLVYADLRPALHDDLKGWTPLYFPQIPAHIDGLLQLADLAYRDREVSGLLRVQASLHRVLGVQFEFGGSTFPTGTRDYRSPNAIMTLVDETLNRNALSEARSTIVKRATRSLLWSCGCSWDDDSFETWFSKNTRYRSVRP